MPLNDALRPTQGAIASSLYSHKMLLYALVSSIAVTTTVVNALKRHSNFYSLAIYLSKSNRTVIILANFGLLIALLCGRAAQRIFFGALRPQEVERLHDRLWFFITESLLAFTIFRDDFDIPFILMFGFLLFIKSFHWLASDRIEWMDQRPYPGPPVLFHIRIASLLFLLWFIDTAMFALAVDSTTKNGVGGTMMFASEYAILMASALNITAKYIICVIDLRRAQQRGGENAPPWQNKSMWVFYVELVTDFLKLTTYLVFFMLIVAFYGLPLNIIRDVYLTGKSFITRLRALFRYRAATRNMEERYPDATDQEMRAMTDRTCIICREEMSIQDNSSTDAQPVPAGTHDGPNTTPKKLPCGHIFHFYCLRSWLERQQSCPTCRRSVLDSPPQAPNRPQHGPAPQPRPPPRQPNPFGFPGPQHPQGVNNGLARIFDRLAGNAAQTPLTTGPNPGHQNANMQGWLPGPVPGVVIQYNIQYQNTQQHEQAQIPPLATTPTTLRPLPPFGGFVGPDQHWRPWGMNHRWSNQEATRSRTDVSNNRTATEPSITSPLVSEGSQTPTETPGRSRLHRFPTTAGLSPNESTTTCNTTTVPLTLPSLIPLDPVHVPVTPAASRAHVDFTPRLRSPTLTASHTSAEAIVSDAQLMLMHHLTREAIDERLRILENVSTTINRCVVDLMRVRSALPISPNTSIPRDVASDPIQSHQTAQSEIPTSSKNEDHSAGRHNHEEHH
ncbi:hypothetical protein V8B97DRAFT_1930850 [Scleroderma yunnanense]